MKSVTEGPADATTTQSPEASEKKTKEKEKEKEKKKKKKKKKTPEEKLQGSSKAEGIRDALPPKKTRVCRVEASPQRGCNSTDFGCCPDGVTPAEGPFSAGYSLFQGFFWIHLTSFHSFDFILVNFIHLT